MCHIFNIEVMQSVQQEFLVIFDEIANILNLPRVLYSLIVNLATIFKTKYLLVFWAYHEIV